MTDSNVGAVDEVVLNRLEAIACTNAGFLPVTTVSSHPAIVYRWGIEYRDAPVLLQVLGGRQAWCSGLWVPAWVWALFSLNRSTDLFANALTTVQENKLRIATMKRLYDEALNSPEKQLVLLTEFQLSRKMDEWLALGVTAAIRRAQWALDNE